MGKNKKKSKPKAEGAAPPMALVGFKITDTRTKTNTPKQGTPNQPATSNTVGGAPPKIIDGMSVKKVKVVKESKQKVKPTVETTEVTEIFPKSQENEEISEAGNEEALSDWDDADENSFNFPSTKDTSNEESTVQDKQNNSWFLQKEGNNQTVSKSTAGVLNKNDTCSSNRGEAPEVADKGAVHKELPRRNSPQSSLRDFEKNQHGKHNSSAWPRKEGSYSQGSHQEDMKKSENRGQNRSRERGTDSYRRESGGRNQELITGTGKHDSSAWSRKEGSNFQGSHQEDMKKSENRGQNRSRERGTDSYRRQSGGRNQELITETGKHDSSAWSRKEDLYSQGSHQEDMKKSENRGQNRSRERGTDSYRRESGGRNQELITETGKHHSSAWSRKEGLYSQGSHQEDMKKSENQGQNRSRERGTDSYRRESGGRNQELITETGKHHSSAWSQKEGSYSQGSQEDDMKKFENRGQNRSRERGTEIRGRNQEHNTGRGAWNSSSDYSQDKYRENRTDYGSKKQSRVVNDSYEGGESEGRNQEHNTGKGAWNSSSADYSQDKYRDNRTDYGNKKQSRVVNDSYEGRVSEGRNQEYNVGTWSSSSSDYSREKYQENRKNSGNQKSNRSGGDWYPEVRDKGFGEFWSYLKSSREKEYVKVKEIEGDLFAMPKEYALAHCVAEDMAMGSGIAVQFSRDFKQRAELLQQRAKQGGMAILEIEQRYIYYLVTKRISTGKPTLETLWRSLQEMQKHIEEHRVTQLAMPRIGCGLDRLEWSHVKLMIEYTFRNTDIEIIICNFQKPEDGSLPAPPAKSFKCPVTNVDYPLVQIEPYTAIVYFGFEDGFVSEEIESLDTKFRILQDYQTSSNKRVGEVIRSERLQKTYILYGFIVNKSKNHPFDFTSLQNCVTQFKKMNVKENASQYVGIQAFMDDDDLIMSKIVNLLRSTLYGLEIYVCWPGKMAPFKPQDRRDNYY